MEMLVPSRDDLSLLQSLSEIFDIEHPLDMKKKVGSRNPKNLEVNSLF